MEQKKLSEFRQSGWKELSTGDFHIFYGLDKPADEAAFVKLWDIMVKTETTTQHMMEPHADAPSVM